MDFDFSFVLALIFVWPMPLISSFNVTIGHWIVLQKHIHLVDCVVHMVRQNEYVGARLSSITGTCEGLLFIWAVNQTTEAEYGYARKLDLEQKFEPPIELGYMQKLNWMNPIFYESVARVDIYFTCSKPDWRIELSKAPVGADDYFTGHTRILTRESQPLGKFFYDEFPSYGKKANFEDYIELNTLPLKQKNEILKLSFSATNDSVQILRDNSEIMTRKLNFVRIGRLRQLFIAVDDFQSSFFLYSVRYSAA